MEIADVNFQSVIPRCQKPLAVGPQMADDIAEFVRREPCVHRYREIVKPEFGFPVAGSNVNVRWFVSFIGIAGSSPSLE
jgi:hypothetical protein